MTDADSAQLYEGHVTFVATTGSGKTYLMRKHIEEDAACPPFVVFLDGKRNTKLRGFHVLKDPERWDPQVLQQHQRVRILMRRGREGAKLRGAFVDDLCTSLLEAGEWLQTNGRVTKGEAWLLLVVDEAGRDAPMWDMGNAGGGVVEFSSQAHEFGMRLWAAVQDPSMLSKMVVSNSQRMVVMAAPPTMLGALKRLHKVEVPAEVRRHVAQRHHFAILNQLTGEWTLFPAL